MAAPTLVRGIAEMGGGLGYPGLENQAVLGAELQYFRMSPGSIQARLDLCAQARFNLMQTYVPWNVHEFFPGTFDFAGKTVPILPDDHFDEYQLEDPLSETQAGGVIGRFGLTANTNLEAYLAQCAAMGFKMILRPGPFISDEWRSGGLPDWLLLEGDPTMFEYGPDGTSFGPGVPFSPPLSTVTGGSTLYYFSSPSYASARYLDATKVWLGAFVEFLRAGKWFIDQGGPVVGLQVDDESCFFYRFGAFEVDYNPAMLARWDAYSGGQAPPRNWPETSEGIAALKPAFAWQQFKAEQQALYLGVLADNLRAAGATVPINHELEQNMVPPADMALDAAEIILNGEWYEGSDATVLPLNEIIAQSIRAASRQQRPTYSTETETGDALIYNILIGEGIYGGLQFTYTEGVEDGTLDILQPIGRTFAAAGPMLGSSTRRADVAVVWDPHLVFAPFGSDRWGFRTDVRNVIERDVPALCTLLIRAGYAFDFLDVAVAQPQDLARYPTIFYAAADILPAAFQQQLVDYVNGGGRLVCWPAPPDLDETLETCTTLADALYANPVTASYPADGQSINIGGLTVPVWRGVTTYELGPDCLEIARLESACCGYARSYGRGVALLLGSWLAADSVAGRAGDLVAQQQISPDLDPITQLAQMAAEYLDLNTEGLLPDLLPGGTPTSGQIWTYVNQRRGGETIASALIGYFDGENVIGLVEVNTDPTEPLVQTLPYHPILDVHIEAIRRLADVVPHVTASDTHLQARVLDGPSGGATVAVANRFYEPVEAYLETVVDGRPIRLPRFGLGTFVPLTGILCPIGYDVGQGRLLVAALAQLLDVVSTPTQLSLNLVAPGGGDVVLDLEAMPISATRGGQAMALSVVERFSDGGVEVAFDLLPGEYEVVLIFSN